MSTFALGRFKVRRSGYGAMQLAGQFASGSPPDRPTAVGVLQAAVLAGVDHIDAAQYYGPGTVNELIRDALYPYPSELAIVSKVAGDAHDLRQGIKDNLRTLRIAQLAAVNLRLPGDGRVDARFDDQLAAMVVIRTAARLGITPAQVALQWLLRLAPNVLLIPGTGSLPHLRENLAAEGVTLDDEALRELELR